MSSQVSTGETPKLFPPTRWSVVLAATRGATPQSVEALEAICRAYWHPLYVHVRRSGRSPHDAQDITQEFFAQLIELRWLDRVDREKGRLRTFLLVALKHFMVKEWRQAAAQKRGGGQAHLPIDTTLAESLYTATPDGTLGPDEVFDRQWALTLLDLALKRLEVEYGTAGKAAEFAVLKGCLMAARGAIDYEAVAVQLGGNPGAARVAVHRLRKRFREVYREEILQTLPEHGDLEAEMRHLAAALARD
jgi:RNA polymerase sigma-70 factor (ECF subfamily)